MTSQEQIRKALFDASIALSNATHNDLTEYDAEKCLAKVDAALALPRRNCDVGTAHEQTERYTKFCESHRDTHGNCISCHACKMVGRCEFHWSQMPYEKDE